MAKVVSEKQINSFVKGLITEASPLTYPENSSLDEDNFELLNNGSRKRRLGIDYETGYTYNATGIATNLLAGSRVSVHYWPFPGGSTTVSLAVIRIQDKLYFINLLAASPSSALLTSASIASLNTSDIQTAVVNGNFIITTWEFTRQVIALSWNPTTNLLNTITYPYIQIRDFYGVYENIENDFRPIGPAITDTHNYNLQNQGWGFKMLSTCGAAISAIQCTYNTADPRLTAIADPNPQRYPSNADKISYGKTGNAASATFDQYDPLVMFKNSLDSSYVSRGHFIIGYASRNADRLAKATGITTLPADTESGTILCVASYAGRAFYSGIVSKITNGDLNSPNYSGYIFFSQVATSKDKLDKCYQENDPTSPEINDILDTDGGTIHIPEASRIVRMVPVGQSLLVFAENGVWEIYGDTGGFTATSYQVSKVNSFGTLSANSTVEVSGSVFYWAKSGIYVLSPDPTSGRFTTQSISLNTIQTLYNTIPSLGKQFAKVIYDESKNTIRWLYNDSSTYSETNYINTYTKQLNLDLTLQAFSKYSFSNLDVTEFNLPRICGFVKIPNNATTTFNYGIVAGADTVIAGADTVIITSDVSTSRESSYRYLTMKGASFTLSELNNTSFKDWYTENTAGVDYSSYLVTGYEYAGDIMREKQVMI
jgi:hypothetical protein